MRVELFWERCWEPEEVDTVEQAVMFAKEFFNLKGGKLEVLLDDKLESGSVAEAFRLSKKKFMLAVSKEAIRDTEDLLKCVFHEMTHIKQYKHNGLRFGTKKVELGGQKYPFKDSIDYWLSPWEMEARAMEEALLFFWGEANEKCSS